MTGNLGSIMVGTSPAPVSISTPVTLEISLDLPRVAAPVRIVGTRGRGGCTVSSDLPRSSLVFLVIRSSGSTLEPGVSVMDPAEVVRVFTPDEVPLAAKFIESLPENARVYVDVWADDEWYFAFFDDQRFAASSLSLLRPGQHFRVRGAYARGAATELSRSTAPARLHGPQPSGVILVPQRWQPRRRWRALRSFLRHIID